VPRLLLIDDDPAVRALLRAAAADLGAETLEAGTGGHGVALATRSAPDLVVLDLRLPDLPGIEVLRQLRRRVDSRVVVFSTLAEELEKVRLLEAGADDYLVKPVGQSELTARLRAHLRRAAHDAPGQDGQVVRHAGVELDFLRRRVTRDGAEIRLTPTEWNLLRALAEHAGRTLSHQQLWDLVWGRDFGDAHLHVRVQVARLRRKIEPDPSDPAFVRTVSGIGYRFEVPV
jgi:two-component system KDP operon response regulator KdpE